MNRFQKTKLKNYKTMDEKNIIILALIYYNRYLDQEKKSIINKNNIYNSCLSLANKFLIDNIVVKNNNLELFILKKIDWNVFVTCNEFNKWNSILS